MRRMELLDFPNEVLESIAQHLDPTSLASLAVVSHRMRHVVSNVKKRIRLNWIDRRFIDRLPCRFSRLENLDLSSCLASSECMRAFILRCTHLKSLNVINASLSFKHVLDVLRQLQRLTQICFSVLSSDAIAYVAGGAKNKLLDTGSSIVEAHIEVTPQIALSTLVADFLNSCQSIELVRVNVIGRSAVGVGGGVGGGGGIAGALAGGERGRLNAEVWQTLRTVVISCHLSDTALRNDLLQSVFPLCSGADDVRFWARDNMQFFTYVPGHVARTTTAEVVATRNSAYVKGMAHLSFSPHLAVINAFKPFSGEHSAIVDIDLTACHSPFTKKSWNMLVEKLPALQALAVPICFWPHEAKFDWHRNTPPVRDCIHHPRNRNFAIEALRRICLKKLFVTGRPSSTTPCTRCQNSAARYSLGSIGQLTELEEFTLQRVHANPNIFEDLAPGENSKLRTLRLCFDGMSSVHGLRDFLRRCVSLRYLKLEGINLPVHCERLWSALLAGTGLRQVCLTSELSVSVDVQKIAVLYLCMVARLDVLHVHLPNIQQHDELKKCLLDAAQEVVGPSTICPHGISSRLHYCQIDKVSWTNVKDVYVESAMPGRALCTATNRIARLETRGWNVQ